ncbi:Zn-dependent hydrolase/oxidoreductase [Aureobasidium pullulans]|uniref:Zn-dependent hydrolase/oxidoreductase n=1 Tax=Aureobasidium pullulans TaxID=5580 RepID=A0A4S9VD47_AURPU|nr:Zn-dependent hydrolase/oxidoreductase [Aureobasidium pullulans]TIA78815.1 Zn-dependent hydrolase/oxidoreductase [Aureobasidium pullulans]
MSSASTSSALYATVSSSSRATGAVPKNTKELRHHNKNGKGFINPWDSYVDRTAPQIISALIWRKLSGKQNTPDTTPPTVPVQKPEFLPTRETKTLRATWLGHACYYVEFPSGLRVLFDPVFEPRCSPLSFMGPKRYTPAPVDVADIPIIDAVVISHSHYDHLSYPTILKIKEKHPNAHFWAPLGNKPWFSKCGIENMTELDWWESRDFTLSAKKQDAETTHTETGSTVNAGGAEDIKAVIGCLPCQHTSARTPFDKSHTLWGSWSIESGGKKIWFGGDTGYRSVPDLPEEENDYDEKHNYPTCPAFKEIGELRGPFDLGLIPIGAYDPRFIMSPMHANPFDSVNIFIDTQCKKALGIHWGTWVLTEEEVLEPPKLLKKAMAWKSLPETGVFDVCNIGESREY